MSDSRDVDEIAPAPSSDSRSGSKMRWRLPLLLAIVLVAVFFLNRYGIRQFTTAGNGERAAAVESSEVSGQAVSLSIDFGDGKRRDVDDINWYEGMTVADALTAAGRRVEDPVTFAQQGTAAAAFLTQLGDQSNEGAGGRNWTYSVNGKRANRSFAVYSLQPGDKVLWRFAGPR